MSSGDFDQHQLDNDFRQACSLGNIDEVQRNIMNSIVDINVADKYEQFTGLHMACEHGGHYEIVKYLLENNANVNCQNSLGETPIIIALKLDAKSSHSNKIKINFEKRNKIIELLLLYGADLDIGYSKDIDSKSQPKATHCAVILGDINIIRKLLNKNQKLIQCKDLNGAYPIHYAAKYNKVFAMQELIAYGSQLEPTDKNGWTPFHVACDNKRIDIVQFILDQGGHMNTKTNVGDQPLHIACRHKVKDIIPIVSFLISQGADQHQTDSKGKCLKHYMKENIFLKHVISLAKEKNNKSSSFPASASSFGVLNLKGDKLYTSSGYQLDINHNNKKITGNITLYQHGFIFSYKKGFISKSTVEQFYQWKPYIELIADKNQTNLLKMQYSYGKNAEMDEKKQFETDKMEEMYKFGIIPCRPGEIIEAIQKEINKMYPTYSLQNEIKIFINGINEGNGIKDIVDEYNELNTNIINSINESNEINDNNNDKYNKLQSEINTMNVRVMDITNNIKIIWNECENLINNKIQPLINDLRAKIDSMVNNNEHWKIISNVRKSMSFAMENKEKLMNIKTEIEFIVNKE